MSFGYKLRGEIPAGYQCECCSEPVSDEQVDETGRQLCPGCERDREQRMCTLCGEFECEVDELVCEWCMAERFAVTDETHLEDVA